MNENTLEVPALSASIGEIAVSQSPLHAWSAHRLLGNVPRAETDAMVKGRLYHQLLVPGGARLEVCDFKDWRTKAAQEAKAEAREGWKTPILKTKYEEAMVGVEKIRTRLLDEHGIDLSNGQTEVRIEWNEPAFAGAREALCHGVLDWLSYDRLMIRDLKTGDGVVTPEACANSLVRMGGALQHAAYVSAANRIWPELAGRTQMQFIFAETRPPYAVIVAECAGSMRELGETRWQRAIEIWAQCLATDIWPGPAEGVARLEAPSWALAAEIAKEDEES